jgi:hypothetical protein
MIYFGIIDGITRADGLEFRHYLPDDLADDRVIFRPDGA